MSRQRFSFPFRLRKPQKLYETLLSYDCLQGRFVTGCWIIVLTIVHLSMCVLVESGDGVCETERPAARDYRPGPVS